MSKEKILITGANGFLGSNLTKYLSRNSDYEVFAMVRPRGTVNFLHEFQKDPLSGKNLFELIEANLSDDESVGKALSGMDTVIHLAGMVSDWGPREQFFDLNVEGTKRVLKGATAAGVTKVIYLSSLTVHAMNGHIDSDENTPADMKNFSYGETKKLGEDLVRAWGSEGSRSSAVVRPGFVIYGAYDKNTFINVLDALKSGTFGFIDGGKRLISYVYAENLCYGIEKLIKADQVEGAYNILDGNMTWKEWIRVWADALSVKVPRLSVPYWLMFPFVLLVEGVFKLLRLKNAPLLTLYRIRIMHRDLSFSNERMKKEFAYKAHVPFESTVNNTLDFYKLSKK
jgi:nucleoside-diphosphate-sugar epimerase